jgi:hypothetical protein
MTDTDGTCEYVLDPDNPETWGGEEGDECYVDEEVLNEDGVWTCPHNAEENTDLCIFHISNSEKDSNEVNSAFKEKISDISDNSGPVAEELQFIGAYFKELNLNKKCSRLIKKV